NNGRDLLLETPLKDIANGLADFDVNGQLNTKIDMSLGLDDSSNLKLKGEVTPLKNRASVKLDKVIVNKLNGKVNFSERGVENSRLNGIFYDEPMRIDLTEKVIERSGEQSSSVINAKVSGKINEKVIVEYIGETWGGFFNGTSNFSAEVNVFGGEQSTQALVEINSDLKGISIDLPDELNKPKDSSTPLNLKIELGDKQSVLDIYWQKLKGKWAWNNASGDTTGAVFYYNQDKELSDNVADELFIEATVDEVNYELWSPLIEKLHLEKQKKETSKNNLKVGFTLKIGKLNNEWLPVEQLEVAAHKPEAGHWIFGIHSKQGNALIRAYEDKPTEIEINDLNFWNPGWEEESGGPDSSDTFKIAEPTYLPHEPWELLSNWPSMKVSCTNCIVQKRNLGNVELDLTNSDNQLVALGTAKYGKQHDLKFELVWQQEEKEAVQEEGRSLPNQIKFNDNTSIEFQLVSGDVGSLMKHWQYPVGIEESSATTTGKMSWQERPWNFSPLTVNGESKFRLGKGYLSEISDAKARLFSLFNLQSLSRRLRLDFKDVYKKGFFYDKLTGDVKLTNAIVSTDNVYVDGNAAKVTLSGQIDLRNETIEQHAIVIPQLTSSLPVLVGWAVEPTTGLLVYLVNKIMEPAVEVVTQIEYRIHGSLDDIKVDEVKKQKSKVKYETEEEKAEEKEEPAEENSSTDKKEKVGDSQ
ncbi:MAG: DUF3971 domain-containing protein, partial [Kangiellaceae bacterium]|nr:DUF3971 domain-containing protein [Kangiellaceae bacterium]